MFCASCGTKNKEGDIFCSNCGQKLEQNSTEVDKKVKEVPAQNINNQQMPTKKNNGKIILFIILAIIIGVGYKLGSDYTSPKKIAESYIDASISGDSNKLYKYLKISGDKTFVSKSVFKKLCDSNKTNSNINNYKITGVEYGEGKLTATVKFSYTTKNSSTERTDSISLAKQKTKKYLIFDNWEVADTFNDSMLVKDFSIKVPKNTKVEFSSVKVDKKYLSKKDSKDNQDVYVLPQVFAAETTIKATLENGMKLSEKVVPSSYRNSYTLSYDKNSLNASEEKDIINSSKKMINDLYNSAIQGKKYSDIKNDYSKAAKDFEENYNKFVSNIENSSNKLKSFSIKSGSIYSLRLTDDGYIRVELKLDYDYKVEYTSYDNEVKTSEKSNYGYMTIVINKEKNKYNLIDIDNLKTYFYR